MTRSAHIRLLYALATLAVPLGCAQPKELPPVDDRLGSVSELQDSQFGHIDRAATAVEEARKANR